MSDLDLPFTHTQISKPIKLQIMAAPWINPTSERSFPCDLYAFHMVFQEFCYIFTVPIYRW